jgi:hypothetical protein
MHEVSLGRRISHLRSEMQSAVPRGPRKPRGLRPGYTERLHRRARTAQEKLAREADETPHAPMLAASEE